MVRLFTFASYHHWRYWRVRAALDFSTLRRVVLRRIAGEALTTEEVQRMTAVSKASADESRRLLEEFVDEVFADRPDDPFAVRMRSALPMLPDRPADEQVDAWVDLPLLCRTQLFARESLRWLLRARAFAPPPASQRRTGPRSTPAPPSSITPVMLSEKALLPARGRQRQSSTSWSGHSRLQRVARTQQPTEPSCSSNSRCSATAASSDIGTSLL